MSVTNVMLEAFMQLATARQEVFSRNIANVNTPGVLAQEIAMPVDFRELVQTISMNSQVQLQLTRENHIQGSKPRLRFKTLIDKDGVLKPNGNNIDLAEQSKKAAENAILYNTALSAYKNSSDLVKAALGKK